MLGQSCCKMKVSCCEFRALSFYPTLNLHKRLTFILAICEWLPMNHSQKWFTTHNVFSVCLTENTNMSLISSLQEGGKTFWLDPFVTVAVHTVGRQEPKLWEEETTASFVMILIFCHGLFHDIILGLKITLQNLHFKQNLYSFFSFC